ncbi:hypothetical protein E2C01_033287 [Portunus trituberculatus]|uniref:Uncharacterized protein n=1 Tax=Portunus trituberculatus TaxID=210409 RepID=A0A5B7F3C7_PORTR|nr:hypothetical protein [Portunus trituberculatus]
MLWEVVDEERVIGKSLLCSKDYFGYQLSSYPPRTLSPRDAPPPAGDEDEGRLGLAERGGKGSRSSSEARRDREAS